MNPSIRIFLLLAATLMLSGSSFNETPGTAVVEIAGRLLLPDVMNNVNIMERHGEAAQYRTVNLDTFPLFSGFPKHISGQSIEGGIVCNMDDDPELELVYNIGFTIQAWKLDGSSVPGWPKTVPTYPLEGAPAFGDIDGDGIGEIVVTTRGATSGGALYAFKRNGTNVPGFPVNHGYSTRTPVLADLNGDDTLEIIINKRLSSAGEVWVYRGRGTVYLGWPKAIGHVPASSAAVGDINDDGVPEVIGQSYDALYAWTANGDTVPGFPFYMPLGAVNSYSSPVLADVDRDGFREIIFGTHVLTAGGYVFILKKDGTQLPNWPQATGYWIYGPPAIGYIDADTLLDIAVGDQVLSGIPTDYLFAWNSDGLALQGFPIGPMNAINNQVAIGDIDSDGMVELIVDDNTSDGIYLAFNHDGTPVTGWPIATTGTTFFNMPCLTDVNRDGILDIVGAAREGISPAFTNVYLWNTGISYSPASMIVPVWQYNVAHDGVYGTPSVVGVRGGSPVVPGEFALYQNYPNPFNPSTSFRFQVTSSTFVTLKVVDLLGREVATLVNEVKQPGTYEVHWDATAVTAGRQGLASGMYIYRMQAGEHTQARKSIYIK